MSFRQARKEAGKSIEEVRKYMGVSRVAVYNWERGEYHPKITTLRKLAQFYGCTVDRLLEADAGNQIEGGTH